MDVTVNKTRSQYQVLFCFQSRISVMSRFIRSRLCIDAYFLVADVEVADYSLRVLLGWPFICLGGLVNIISHLRIFVL